MRLQAVDWLLLRSLMRWDGSASPTAPLRVPVKDLAAAAGVHPNSVRRRLLALRRGGVLEGFMFHPRPEALGFCRSAHLCLGASLPDAETAMAALAAFPSTSTVILYEGQVFVELWHANADNAEGQTSRLRQALGATNIITTSPVDRRAGFAGHATVSVSDWAFVATITATDLDALAQAAKKLRVGARTLQRRIQRLVRDGAGAVLPRFRPARLEGTLLVGYFAQRAKPGAGEALAAAFPDRIVGPLHPDSPIQYVYVPMPSLQEAERRRIAAESVAGIPSLSKMLVQDLFRPPAFAKWLGSRVPNPP